MQKRVLALAGLLWPELKSMPLHRQLVGIGEVLGFLYGAPLAVAGLVWLASLTDQGLILDNLGLFALFALLIILFYRLSFFLIIQIRADRYGSSDGSMVGIVLWSSLLLLGPSALWLPVLWFVVQFAMNYPGLVSTADIWNQRRNLTMSLAGETLVPLLAFSLYRSLGGEVPFPALTQANLLVALAALASYALLFTLVWAPYFGYNIWVQKTLSSENPVRPLFNFFFLSLGLPQLVLPFALLAASLYVQNGLVIYLFFMSGMLVVAFLTRRLSLLAESSRQQSRMLEKLERFSRDIINAPASPEVLPEILAANVPDMFPSGKIVIWNFPDEVLFNSRPDWQLDLARVWTWLVNQTKAQIFLARDNLPWENQHTPHNPTIIAHIKDVESEQPIAGIYLELHTLAQPWDRQSLRYLLPAVVALADQIAAAYHKFDISAQALEGERLNQELRLASNIQATLLPYIFPSIPGWQLAVSLNPANEMSGDFFDIIALPEGRVGLVIADVLDKGFGPALYMALSRTLIRTYATEFDLSPDTVFFSANERILSDTSANLFVTAFYGILDPAAGTLTYSNAGHNPPYLFNGQTGQVNPLGRTGIPIGIDEDAVWESHKVQLEPGDALVLYTDGIPEAQNGEGDFFEEGRLIEVIQENLGGNAEELQSCILGSIEDFLGGNAPQDDITLMVLRRD